MIEVHPGNSFKGYEYPTLSEINETANQQNVYPPPPPPPASQNDSQVFIPSKQQQNPPLDRLSVEVAAPPILNRNQKHQSTAAQNSISNPMIDYRPSSIADIDRVHPLPQTVVNAFSLQHHPYPYYQPLFVSAQQQQLKSCLHHAESELSTREELTVQSYLALLEVILKIICIAMFLTIILPCYLVTLPQKVKDVPKKRVKFCEHCGDIQEFLINTENIPYYCFIVLEILLIISFFEVYAKTGKFVCFVYYQAIIWLVNTITDIIIYFIN